MVVYGLLIFGSAIYAFPFYWMIITALKTEAEIYAYPPAYWPPELDWANFPEMWEVGPFGNWIRNSLIIAVAGTFGHVLSSLAVAFGFARFIFPGRGFLFIVLLATMMLPGHVTIIPRYIFFSKIGWLETLWPLIVPAFFATPFYVFLLRQFIMTLPIELDEAAKIDGASSFHILTRIVIPLSRPAIAVVAIFSFIGHWTDFFEPLLYLRQPDNLTLQVGLQWFNTLEAIRFDLLMAASMVSVVPIVVLFFFTQKQFIQGIQLTGIKA